MRQQNKINFSRPNSPPEVETVGRDLEAKIGVCLWRTFTLEHRKEWQFFGVVEQSKFQRSPETTSSSKCENILKPKNLTIYSLVKKKLVSLLRI